MKKILLALLVVLLTLAWGCAPKDSGQPAGESPNDKSPAASHTATLSETEAPKYFVPSAMLPDGSLFGMSGSQITAWDPQSGTVKTFGGDAWSAVLSPDGEKIAYIDEQGLHLLDISTNTTAILAEHAVQDDSSLAPGVWSPDASKFMYMFVREWTSDFYIHHVATGENTAYEFKNMPNFLSRPVDWRESGLFFAVHANQSKTGAREYRENGYRADLVLGDDEGNLTPVTRMDDGQFALYCGATRDDQNMLVVIWEEDSHTTAGLLDVASGEIEYLPVGDQTVGGSISPDGEFAVLITAIDEGGFNARLVELESKAVVLEKELPGYEPPYHFLWSDDSRKLSFGMPGSDDSSLLYTIVID